MKPEIDPATFSRLMRLPDGLRYEVLEFAGAASLNNEQLDQLIAEVTPSRNVAGRKPH